jgi:hypothetical protein
MEHAGAGMCPSEPIDKSAPNRYRRTIELAPELSELSISTIKQGARLAVGSVVMIDERGEFRYLILKPSIVRRVRGARPLSRRISRTSLQSTQCRKNSWMISVDRIA